MTQKQKQKTIFIRKGRPPPRVVRPPMTTRLVPVPREHDAVPDQRELGKAPDSQFFFTPTVVRHRGLVSQSPEHTLLQNMYDGVVLADVHGRILDTNLRAGRVLHGTAEQLRQFSVLSLIEGADEEFLAQLLELTAGRRHVLLDARCVRLDGEMFPAEIAVITLNIGKRDQICLFIRDVSERKRLEDDLRKAQARLARVERIEATSLLAGQIAHDLNNLVAPMLAYPELLKDEVLPQGKGVEYVRELEACARQIREVTRGLLDLSTQGKVRHSVLDIGAVCEGFVQRYLAGAKNAALSVVWRPPPEPVCVSGNSAQLARVLSNLCGNAADAMPRGGAITVAVERVEFAEPAGNHVDVPAGVYAAVSVADTGCGIPEAIRDRIFDPFFTTKNVGTFSSGSGLGLSVVYSIAKDHGGFADFETNEGSGSKFVVYIPVAEAGPPSPAIGSQENPPNPPRSD